MEELFTSRLKDEFVLCINIVKRLQSFQNKQRKTKRYCGVINHPSRSSCRKEFLSFLTDYWEKIVLDLCAMSRSRTLRCLRPLEFGNTCVGVTITTEDNKE